MKRDLVIECRYDAPVHHVWRAITDPAILAEWLMENDFSATPGARCQFRMKPQSGFNGIIECEVLEVDPPRRLVYTWDGGGPFGKTTLTWTLESSPAGTTLRLEHRGFAGFRPFLLSIMMSSGWNSKLNRIIPAILARLATEKVTQ